MNKTFYLPIEGYDERYTNQLNDWVMDTMKKNVIPHDVVEGIDITHGVVSHGQVLDAFGRPYYCMTQMTKLIEKMSNDEIKNNDNIFTMDIWQLGIECVPYASALIDKNINIYGFNCAGTFEKKDFLFLKGLYSWGRYLERCYFSFANKIFFASEKLRNMAIDNLMFDDTSKAVLTGLATNTKYIRDFAKFDPEKNTKKPIVVFSHRLDEEKRLDIFLKVAEELHDKDIEFVVTTGRKNISGTSSALPELRKMRSDNKVTVYTGLSKFDYYQILKKSSIIFSSAEQDTVGNAMLESISLGCIPVVTDNVSYHEYLPSEFIYNHEDVQQAVDLILEYIHDRDHDCHPYIKKYDRSLDRMYKAMGYDIDVDELKTHPTLESE